MTIIRTLFLISATVLGLGLAPTVTHAGLYVAYGFDNALAQQTVNFKNQPAGPSVVGDTNPPHPFYDVTATSLDTTILAVNGGHVVSSPAGGILAVSFTPESPYAWTYFDVQLDSLLTVKDQNNDVVPGPGLTIDLWRGGILQHSELLNFPWEGNSGENQHYYAYATGGDYFDRVDIVYAPPTSGDYAGNMIHEIHNIDVATINTVPEPSTLMISTVLLGLFGMGGLRKRLNRTTRRPESCVRVPEDTR